MQCSRDNDFMMPPMEQVPEASSVSKLQKRVPEARAGAKCEVRADSPYFIRTNALSLVVALIVALVAVSVPEYRRNIWQDHRWT
jgi:hypothetical protein